MLLDETKLRLLEASCEKGASNWLSCLPLKAEGFSLNKQEFQDSICIRYGWPLKHLPSRCPCGNEFTIHHAMSCKLGGFVHYRHNEVRDVTGTLLKEVCTDVSIEPMLIPLTGEKMKYKTANTANDARLDISARGFWVRGQRAFYDVRIFDSTAPRQLTKPLSDIHKQHEQEKRRVYNQRILEVEQGTFTPLVFTIQGGMSQECQKFYSRLATLLSEKRNETKSTTTAWMRTRISFSLLRSALLCVRGSRTTAQMSDTRDINFDLTSEEAKLK